MCSRTKCVLYFLPRSQILHHHAPKFVSFLWCSSGALLVLSSLPVSVFRSCFFLLSADGLIHVYVRSGSLMLVMSYVICEVYFLANT
ncbi:hypothetical protein BDV98DRAFT_577695 [Pterulicium gracile]|uniref:Uncharacterized protein n=1 Tax=Pterulicium gracile TaxID=1884261 RepID=A0A5C3Q339_9AGAR|nr:hypothetical protein BDV98DRAFT_577695 [Pterula gracilis]